jgi:RNA polymerase sigma factor (sigma-70 family)
MDQLRDSLRRFLADEPYRRLPDDELWARFRDHCEESAFRVILEQVGSRVYARCRAVLGDDSLADEAFQEAFVALFRHRGKMPNYPAAVAWLYETATNTARTHRRWWRRAWRRDRAKAATTPAATAHAAELDVARREQRDALDAALAGLPKQERRAVELVYLEGMTHDEAAEVLGWSRGSVGTYVRRGLDRLRRSLGRREGVALAGLAAVEAALRADPPAVPADRLAMLANGAWLKARAAVVLAESLAGANKVLVVLGACTVAAATGAVVFAWSGRPGPTTRAAASSPTPVETVPQRNLRVFHAEIAPRVADALRGLAVGGGDAVLESAEAYDTRVDCVVALRHRPGWTSRMRLVGDADSRRTRVFFDLAGDGRYKAIDPDRPIVLWRNPLTGREQVIKLADLDRAIAAFDALPRDGRTTAEAAANRDRLRAALARYAGTWYRHGDPAKPAVVELRGGEPYLAWWSDRGPGPFTFGDFGLLRLLPDGQLRGLYVFDSPAGFAADGRRIDFPQTGEWWAREPTGGPGRAGPDPNPPRRAATPEPAAGPPPEPP